MGRIGCTQPPIYHLSCPHKPTYKSCLKCFLLTSDEVKCRCPDEDLTQAESAAATPSQNQEKKDTEVTQSDDVVIIKKEPSEEPLELSDFILKWYPMNVNGVVKDQFENKYTWMNTKKYNNCKEVFYRCTVGDDARSWERTRCPAMVKRVVAKNDGSCISMQLKSMHDHSTRKKLDQEGKHNILNISC